MPIQSALFAGAIFGKLTAIRPDGTNKFKHRLWLWRCVCGKEISRPFQPIKEGRQLSCGCFRNQNVKAINRTHGRSYTRTYRAWIAMKARVSGHDEKSSQNYQGRIRVSPIWQNSFETFLGDMGECPPGLTLERINNDGDYAPGNCEWASRHVQQRNTRRTVRVVFEGNHMCLKDACTAANLPYARIRSRIRSGMDPQAALDRA